MRSALEEELRGIAEGFGDRVLVDGVEFKRHEPGAGKYFCLGGTLLVQRDTYRRVGVHNGPTVVPLELVAGLTEGTTPALGYNVAHGYGQRDMRQHAETLAAVSRPASPSNARTNREAAREEGERSRAANRSRVATGGGLAGWSSRRVHRAGPNGGPDGGTALG